MSGSRNINFASRLCVHPCRKACAVVSEGGTDVFWISDVTVAWHSWPTIGCRSLLERYSVQMQCRVNLVSKKKKSN